MVAKSDGTGSGCVSSVSTDGICFCGVGVASSVQVSSQFSLRVRDQVAGGVTSDVKKKHSKYRPLSCVSCAQCPVTESS